MNKSLFIALAVAFYTLAALLVKEVFYPPLSLQLFIAGELICLLNILVYAWNVKQLLEESSPLLAFFLPAKILLLFFLVYCVHEAYGYGAVLSFLGGYFLFLPVFLLLSAEEYLKSPRNE